MMGCEYRVKVRTWPGFVEVRLLACVSHRGEKQRNIFLASGREQSLHSTKPVQYLLSKRIARWALTPT
jgi:hypothetical protein